MKRSEITQVPAIPVRNGVAAEKINLSDLGQVNTGLVTNTLRNGDKFEFPSEVEDVDVYKQPFGNGTNYLILGLRNEKPYWLSIGSLRRRDKDNQPIHEVSKFVHTCETMDEIVYALLGKTIVGDGEVEYYATHFENGRPVQGEGDHKIVANLRFL